MKLYRTEYYIGGDDPKYSWQGTQLDAAAARKKLIAEGKQGVVTSDVDVPVDKPSLLAWLNINVAGE